LVFFVVQEISEIVATVPELAVENQLAVVELRSVVVAVAGKLVAGEKS